MENGGAEFTHNYDQMESRPAKYTSKFYIETKKKDKELKLKGELDFQVKKKMQERASSYAKYVK